MNQKRTPFDDKANLASGALLPLVFLIFGEAMIAINQTNISSVYLPISEEFNQGVYGLGLLTSVLFLSYFVFEIPGGILAIKFGPKKIAVVGLGLNAFGVIASSFSTVFPALLVFRFVSGVGSAFAFPTLLVLIVRQLRSGSEGLGSGWTVGWSSIGAAIGLMAWPSFAQLEGWRFSIFGSGLISLIPFLGVAFLERQPQLEFPFSVLSSIMTVIKDRKLLILGIALFGVGEGFAILSNFLVYYLEQNYGASPSVAGFVTAISPVVPIIIAPLIGRAHDRANRQKIYFLLAGVFLFAGIGLISIHSFYIIIVAGILVGLGNGIAFTLGFALAKNFSKVENESLGIAWVDTFSLLGSVLSPIYFALIVLSYGYSFAWLIAGVATFLPILSVPLLLKPNSKKDLDLQ